MRDLEHTVFCQYINCFLKVSFLFPKDLFYSIYQHFFSPFHLPTFYSHVRFEVRFSKLYSLALVQAGIQTHSAAGSYLNCLLTVTQDSV